MSASGEWQESALYRGTVRHTRLGPVRHSFEYRLFSMYLDLDELPQLFRKHLLWSSSRPNLAWFRRKDYMEPYKSPLRTAVLDRVESKLGRRPSGPVRMLTHLRTWGYAFNPVTFYYCFETDGEGGDVLDSIVAEITNTPWKERHSYVLDAAGREPEERLTWRFGKDFHVSPFFPMDHEYVWSFGTPGEHLSVQMTNLERGQPVFHAGLELRRERITSWSLARALLFHPLLTARIHVAIYWQAFRLWRKGAPFFTHPDKRCAIGPTTS